MSTSKIHVQKSNFTIALAGNPNSGKTTAFNHYTGSRQHVANYPGVTVEQKEGTAKVGNESIRLVDLPGTYSLTAYSQDELVARKVLIETKIDCVIDVLNAGAIERNLYLAVQIMEMGLPMVLALNMYDEARANGFEIDCRQLSTLLGVPVFPAIARTGEGLDEIMKTACDVASGKIQSNVTPLEISYGPDLDPVIKEMTERINSYGLFTDLFPARWLAIKFLENDSEAYAQCHEASPKLAEELQQMTDNIRKHLKTTLGTYPEAVIADYRYGFISSLLRNNVITRLNEVEERLALSDRIDSILTHRLLGPIILIALLYAMYNTTFVLGAHPQGWVEDFFGWMGELVSDVMPDGLLKSMLVSGIIAGVGGVLSFLPLILIMFLQISILEDSGYMARVAYMLDRVFRMFGLHGYSVMPFIISGGIAGGCAVPGVLAARTLRSPREKLATLLTVPFMTCGAKLPVFLLLARVFFPAQETAVMFIISITAWLTALLVSLLLRSTVIKGEATPFVMELPPYRVPTLLGVVIHTWERVWQYIKKAGTVILAISIVIWAAMTFPELPEERLAEYEKVEAKLVEMMEDNQDNIEIMAEIDEKLALLESQKNAESLKNSLAGRVGQSIEFATAPAGFDWRSNIALLGGIGAKEVIVSTLGTAYSLGEVDPDEPLSLQEQIRNDPHWNKANAAALMVFVLLYAPCFVTLVIIMQETGTWKWAVFSLLFNTALAYAAAVAVYQIGLRLIS